MTVSVGEMTSQVEVQGPPAAGAGGAPGTGALAPSWQEREKHDRSVAQHRRDRDRIAGEGFDG